MCVCVQSAARENRTQNSELKKALEMNRLALHNIQKELEALQAEKNDIALQNELLEQQVTLFTLHWLLLMSMFQNGSCMSTK